MTRLPSIQPGSRIPVPVWSPTIGMVAARTKVADHFVRAIPSTTVRGLLALIATSLLWGLVVVAPEFVADASATSIVGGRFVVLGLVSAIVGRRHLHREVRAQVPWGRAFRYAFAGFVGYYLLLVLAVQRAGPAPVAAVIGVTPVLYALAGARRERLDLRKLAGPGAVLLAGLGLAQIVDLREAGSTGMGGLLSGLVLALASVVVWIWYGLENGRYLRTGVVSGTTWTSIVGVAAGALGLPFLAHGLFFTSAGIGSAPNAWFAVIIVLGMGSAWLGTVAWNAASTLLPESLLGPLIGVEILVGLGYAHAYTRSLPAPITALGYVLLLGGVVFSVVRVDRLRSTVPV